MYERNDNDQWKKGGTKRYIRTEIFSIYSCLCSDTENAAPRKQHFSRPHCTQHNCERSRELRERADMCIGSVTEDS